MSSGGVQPEVLYALRRPDGDDIGDYSFLTTNGPDDWSAARDCAAGNDEPIEFEMVRLTLEPTERRSFPILGDVCDQWTGHESPGRTWYAVEVEPDGTEQNWPVRPASLRHLDSDIEAQEYIARMPEEFWVHPGVEPALVRRSQLGYRRSSIPGYAENCTECGHPKAEHEATSEQER